MGYKGVSLFRTRVVLRAPAILSAGIFIPVLTILWGCMAGRPPAPPDPRAEAERSLAAALKLKAAAWAPADSAALGELVKARLAARSAGRPDLEIQALNEIGALELRRNRFSQSFLAFEQTVAAARRLGNRGAEATAFNGLGDIHLERGFLTDSNSAEAIDAYQKALTLARSVGDPIIEGRALFNLGNAYQARRQKELSLEHYRKAFDLQTRTADGAGRRLTARGLGDLFFEQGEANRARRTLESAIAESSRVRDATASSYLLMSLGSVQLRSGQPEKAVATFEQALKACERVGAPLREAHARIQLATANLHLGERERASLLYREGIDLYERETRSQGLGLPRLLAFPLVFLGTQQQSSLGFAEVRRRFYLPALRLVEPLSTRTENDTLRTTVFHFYGRALNAAGEPREALRFLELTESIAQAGMSYQARTQLEIGKAHRALGEIGRAERELESALAASRELRDLIFEAATLHEIARLERGRGQLRQAVAASTRAVDLIDATRGKVASQHLRTSFFASHQSIYKSHLDLLMELHRQAPREGYDRTALDVSERARARVLLDLLAEGRIDITQAVPARLKSREQTIERRASQLQNDIIRGRGGAALDEAIARTKEDRRQLESEIRQENPRYAEVLHPIIRSVAEIQKLLDDRTALLEYSLTESSVFLFVVTRERFESFRMPITPAQLEERVQDLRRDLLDKQNPYQFILRAGDHYDLYRRLLGEAEKGILKDKRHWLIAADGPLQLLSFEVLLTRPPSGDLTFDQPYLLRERTVHYIPSASVLAELYARSATDPEHSSLDFFALADPDLGSQQTGPASRRRSATGFPPLLEARREVAAIASLFPRGRRAVLQGAEATEGVVKAADSGFHRARRVHLATHGTFDEQRPESSALLLTAYPTGEDGRLTVAEIFNLHVAADLVVLSACNTGQGKQVAGEGLVGMSRAFFYAGAPTLVVSLWPADDASTAQLMASFYRRLQSTPDKAEALQGAKLEMARSSPPYYWAPFILLGRAVEQRP